MNKISFLKLAGIIGIVLMGACSNDDAKQASSDLMLMFEESEPGVDPFFTRMLVNKQFMRLDEGSDQSDFTLFDRKNSAIYTVTHNQKRIMQIKPSNTKNTVTQVLEMDASKQENKDIPSIEGKKPEHYQLKVNGNVCSDVYAIKGLHKEANVAMSEFKRILATIHLNNINNTPAEMLDDCFLAHEVKSPSRSMQFGFPVFQRDISGVTRLLVDFDREYKAEPVIFTLPSDYRMTDIAGSPLDVSL